MPERSGLAAPAGAACPDAGATAKAANAAALNRGLSFIIASRALEDDATLALRALKPAGAAHLFVDEPLDIRLSKECSRR
jgi:hypothetical protein